MIRGFSHSTAIKPPPPFGSCERFATASRGGLYIVTERMRRRDGATFVRREKPMRRAEVELNFPNIEFREGGQV